MGSLELGPEADVSQLEPLLTLENIEQLEATFVAKVQVSLGQRHSAHQLWPLSVEFSVFLSLAGSVPCYILPPCCHLLFLLGKCGPVAAEGTGGGNS